MSYSFYFSGTLTDIKARDFNKSVDSFQRDSFSG